MTEQHHKVRIHPTVGRVVLFHLGNPNIGPYMGWGITPDGSNTYNASVAYVHNEHMLNLTVSDCNGMVMGFQGVTLVQGDDERPAGNWCEWMPYQKGQAAKTEQLEASLATADRVHRAHESGEQRFGEPPFKLQRPGRITYIDSLRLTAKGLEQIADELERRENGEWKRSIFEIQTSLRTIPPLLIAICDQLGDPPTLNTAAHAPGAYDATVTGDGTGKALPPIADDLAAAVDSDLAAAESRRAEEARANRLVERDVRGILNPELHGDSPYASSRADELAPRNPPHPAMAGLVPLDNDGNPIRTGLDDGPLLPPQD